MAFGWFKKKEKEPEFKINFSEVDSQAKAIELFNKKQLAKIYLMPLEFGGQDHAMNVLYAPEFVRDFKARFDAMVENLLVEGKKLSYSASPEYREKSFIPARLVIKVSGEVQFTETIEIW